MFRKINRVIREKIRTLSDVLYSHDRELPSGISLSKGFFCTGDLPPEDIEKIKIQAEQICRHEFDLLGSGIFCLSLSEDILRDKNWIARSIRKKEHRRAIEIRQYVSESYTPIDWQLDWKSGFRWSARKPSRIIARKYQYDTGVDIKVPWELGRFQHLSVLALAFSRTRNEKYLREFENQILDFLAMNPVRFGVHWACTMDVGIRVANWLIAYDLFCSEGALFRSEFIKELEKAIYNHGNFIISHLEYSPVLRGNHYFSNIVGLLFAGAYLQGSRQGDAWLFFALNELDQEIESQFDEEGVNFEASSSYHLFVLEMTLYTLALAHRVEEGRRKRLLKCFEDVEALQKRWTRKIPIFIQLDFRTLFRKEIYSRIEKAISFAKQTSDPALQIGDNDSGKFLCFTPSESTSFLSDLHRVALQSKVPITIPAGKDTDKKQTLSWGVYAYREFGLCVYEYGSARCSLRCGSVGQNGNGGHAHNDALAMTFSQEGDLIIVDSGTGVYTPQVAVRDYFRSSRAHSTILVHDEEQNIIQDGRKGVFSMRERAFPEICFATDSIFEGSHVGYGAKCSRKCVFLKGEIQGTDIFFGARKAYTQWVLSPGVVVQLSAENTEATLKKGSREIRLVASQILEVDEGMYSPRYGIVEKTLILKSICFEDFLSWKLCW